MPSDKWDNPFFYPTKVGGFTWFQKDNALDDKMFHWGKEIDRVEVTESEGKFMFPFLADGDGISLSGSTGHHTGGEEHGCQGFAYMVDNTWDTNPATFRFRKEMYHVHYITDPKTGTWTSPTFNFKIQDHGWVGLGWCRYNKKDGRSAGKDSVICEAWGNPDPVADPTNWVMLKRTEDKGGWGDGGSGCDGEDDQVGTWGNLQFRFKSSSSDFSLHPFPEGENQRWNSIGGENMSFADTEARGYGFHPDDVRDVEMKCWLKKDGTDGDCFFKHLSLREIDPTISFDDTPTTPPEPPVEQTTTLQGNFKLQWDINQLRTSACAGAGGGGGGGGGNTKFYEVYTLEGIGTDKELSDSSTWQNRKRLVMSPANSSSVFKGKLPIQLDIPLKKAGTPGASPVINAKIWSSGGTVLYTSPTTIDPTTLTTSYVLKVFDFSTNTHVLVVGDRIGIEYTGTSSSNYVLGSYQGTAYPNTDYYQYEGTSWQLKSRRLVMDVWE